jgi:hypothetical protein
MVIGLSRTLLQGPQFFISWLVVFLATQNLGGLVGSALFGTLQTVREKFPLSQPRRTGDAQQSGGRPARLPQRAAV